MNIPIYYEDFVPIVALLALFCLLERLISLAAGYRTNAAHELFKVVFAAYLLILFQMTVSLASLWHSYRTAGLTVQGNLMLQPFHEIHDYIVYGTSTEKLMNILGNIFAFVPMGVLPPIIWRWSRKFVPILLWMLVPTCTVELLQRFTPRATSVDDIILNAVGVFLGYLLFMFLHEFRWQNKVLLVKKYKPRHLKKK